MKTTLQKFTETITNIYQIEKSILREIYSEFIYSKINKKEYFISEGAISRTLGIIEGGLFCVSFVTDEGNEYIKYFLSNSEILLGSLEFGEKSRISIRALENSDIFKINYNRFLILCEKFPVLDKMKSKLIKKYWARKEIREKNLLTGGAKKNYEIFKKEYSHLINKIPQHYIASYLGITPTQLSRIKK